MIECEPIILWLLSFTAIGFALSLAFNVVFLSEAMLRRKVKKP